MPLLLTSRRFGWLFTTMLLGAFNDNYYKNAVIILITYVLAQSLSISPEILISFAAASFILPFFLFSGFAGMLADKFPKHRIIRILKITELIIITCATVALWWQHVGALMFFMFMLGTQAAFLGPAKYAILPELLDEKELLSGNGMVEGGTFVSILLGTVFGGLLILRPHGTLLVGASMIAVSFIGVLTGWRVPTTAAVSPGLKIPINPFSSLWEMVRAVLQHPAILKPIIGISWFWAIGAIYLTQLPVFTKEVVGGDEEVVTWFMSLFSIGIAVGSIGCQNIMARVHLKHLSSWSLLGVCLFGIDLVWTGLHLPSPAILIGLRAYLHGFAHFHLSAALFLMAVCGGVFTIPLYTRLQLASGAAQRARAVASNNVMNALFIAGASLLAAGLYAIHWTVGDVLLLFSLANLPVLALMWHQRR